MTSFNEDLIACITRLEKTSAQIETGGENLDCANALERLGHALTYILEGRKTAPKIAFLSATRQASAVSKYHQELFNEGCALYKQWLNQ